MLFNRDFRLHRSFFGRSSELSASQRKSQVGYAGKTPGLLPKNVESCVRARAIEPCAYTEIAVQIRRFLRFSARRGGLNSEWAMLSSISDLQMKL